MNVVYVGTQDAVERLVRREPGAAHEPTRANGDTTTDSIAVEPVAGSLEWLDAEAAVILDVPEAVLAPFLTRKRNGHPPRYVLPAAVAERYPVTALRGVDAPPPGRFGRRAGLVAVLLAAVCLAAVAVAVALLAGGSDEPADRPTASPRPAAPAPAPAPERDSDSVERQAAIPRDLPPSDAVGLPTEGGLVNGVALPREGRYFFTWDATRGVSPNPRFRRFGTQRTIRRLLDVIDGYGRAHPGAAPVGVSDLSLPKGGKFGLEYGGSGHLSHQNGLDVDILYPRTDRRRAATTAVAQIDRRLAQDLVDRFVAAGAEQVFVGTGTGLSGPPAVVQPRTKHDEHMHVRFPER